MHNTHPRRFFSQLHNDAASANKSLPFRHPLLKNFPRPGLSRPFFLRSIGCPDDADCRLCGDVHTSVCDELCNQRILIEFKTAWTSGGWQVTKRETNDNLREIEETQKQLRVSIDKSRELAEESERLLKRYRKDVTEH